jgi:hypothetical protein
MERDAILGHGISAFVNESYMLRSDGVSFRICKGCGTIPIENPKTGLFVCPLCTGPVGYIGSGPNDLELIPPIRKTMVAPVVIEMPYAFKLLSQELETYMNIGMRIMTEKDLLRLTGINKDELPPLTDEERRLVSTLQERVLPEASVPEFREIEERPTEASPELLMKLGIRTPGTPVVSDEDTVIVNATGVQGSIKTAAEVALRSGTPGIVSGSMVQTSNGQVFQPNPTTVTVVPPAVNVGIQKSVQAIGPPEALEADEELGTIPQVLPQAVMPRAVMPQAVMPQAVMPRAVMPQAVMPQAVMPQALMPQALMPQVQPMQQGGYMMPQAQMPQVFQGGYYPMNSGLNMNQIPAIYATSMPQPAQLYTSGVPGVPPTISVSTDNEQMGGFIHPGSVRPLRNNVTAKKRVGFNDGPNQQGGSGTVSSDMKITVIKGT